MSPAPTPRTLKQCYQLLYLIRRGGMGEVWKALDLELRTDCAVKLVRDTDPAALDLFGREQSVLAELRSPHIVSIYDRGIFEDGSASHPFFVMPLLQGMSLADIIAQSSERITVDWLLEVVR